MSDSPHCIRLRGPWDCQPLVGWEYNFTGTVVESPELPQTGRVTMPCDWGAALGSNFRGRVRFTRKFNRPTNLGPAERVRLVFAGLFGTTSLQLNGEPLELAAGGAEITARLVPFNVIVLEVELPPEQPIPSGPFCDVRLEITS